MNNRRLLLALLFLCGGVSSANAQFLDLLGPLFKKVLGVSAWVSYPASQHSPNVNSERTGFNSFRYGLSLKYGPIHLWTSDSVSTSYKLNRQVRDYGDSCSPAKCPKITEEYELEKKPLRTLDAFINFGYSYSSAVDYKSPQGFAASVDRSGFFLSMFVGLPLIEWGEELFGGKSSAARTRFPIHFSVGGQFGIESISDVQATIPGAIGGVAGTIPISVSSPIEITPEIGCGVAFFGKIFFDVSYQYAFFTNLTYSSTSDADAMKSAFEATRPYLPKTLDLSALHLKLGISLTGDFSD